MKKVILFASLFLSSVISLAAHSAPADLYGKWAALHEENGFKFHASMDIRATSTVFTNTCEYRSKTATVSVAVATQVTDKQFKALAAAKKSVKSGDLTCHVDIRKMAMDYTVDGDIANFTFNGETISFNRVN